MNNLKRIIDAKSKRQLNTIAEDENQRQCNCRPRDHCPLAGRCLMDKLIYQCTVTTDENTKTYIGLTENKFKVRLANHK
jgi:hypothetical protein